MHAQIISLVYILCKKIWSLTITPPYLCVYMQYMLVLYALQDCYMWFESYWWFNGMRNYVELHHNSFNSISICKHTYIQTLNGGMINKWSTKIEHIYLNSCKSKRNYFPFETFIGMNQPHPNRVSRTKIETETEIRHSGKQYQLYFNRYFIYL